MATELFCWGYTGWMSGRGDGRYEVAGYIDGNDFYVLDSRSAAERAFCRAAFRAWARRRLRSAVGLAPRRGYPTDPADTYHDFPLMMAARAFLHQIAIKLKRRRR